jgi:hypothetical protein
MTVGPMLRHLSLVGLAALGLAGCGKGDAGPTASASASSAPAASQAAPTASATATVNTFGAPVGIPVEPAKVVKVVRAKEPYKGPTGTLRGKVRIKGDAPPDTGVKIPAKCVDGAATYGKLFRVGIDQALADALVTVIGYDGFVPAAREAVKVTIHNCAFSKRTVAVTYGQRIEVSNTDQVESYMPYLDGTPVRAVMVAVPGGAPVKLYPVEPPDPQPLHYLIRDQLPKEFLTADVFSLRFATHDVTGLDGQYEIKGIPVGKVQVNALLPILDKAVGQPIEIKEGDNTLDLVIPFDAKKDLEKFKAKPAGSAAKDPPGPKG